MSRKKLVQEGAARFEEFHSNDSPIFLAPKAFDQASSLETVHQLHRRVMAHL